MRLKKPIPSFRIKAHKLWEMPPLPDPCDILRQGMIETVRGCLHKELADLTDLEKLALAFMAGVPCHSSEGSSFDKIRLVSEPFSICKVDGKFHIYTKETIAP